MEWTEPASRLFTISVVLVVLSAAFVALRLVSRGWLLRVLGPTDWFMVLFAILNTVFVGVHISFGLGRSPIELGSDQQKRDFFKVQYFAYIINNLSLVLTKISVLLLFLNVFLITWVRKATYVVLGATVFYGVWLTMSNIFACIPIYAYWDMTPDSTCILGPAKYFTDAGISLTLDFVMLFLPVPIIWPMTTLRRAQKAWLCFLFAMGFCVCIVSVLRAYFVSLARTDLANASTELDVIYWCILEMNLPIMIACIPTLSPLAAKLYPRLRWTPRERETDRHPPTIASAPRRLHSFDSLYDPP
ncbi:hypothetical protein C8A00DRAFT_36468 [Chaetomidium leptoderma]|uniref:Rhodopsin domain-containing protein n=1 Tax=Chaetomidium leptoderma TaxID=669021 RepID=A0AAN6ZU05_9PEZI|nr:hypothetical protein C8A00DRAFT_36468 [Chaetomidium leptoderma]